MKLSRAECKKMFWDYACSHFLLDRDGVRERHPKYQATPEEEVAWKQEYVQHWTDRLSIDDLEPLRKLENAGATESLPRILALAAKGDNFSKLQYANVVWEFSRELQSWDPLYGDAEATACRLWKQLTSGCGEISAEHEAEITADMKIALSATSPAEYVRNYARRQLDKYYT